MLEKYQEIVDEFVKQWEKEKWFPVWYCNPCAKALHKILTEKWFSIEQMFTYETKWEWHTFLLSEDWIIIDPTYGQYDNCFLKWFVWKSFPNEELQKNIMWWKEFMKLQKVWLDEWVYKFI